MLMHQESKQSSLVRLLSWDKSLLLTAGLQAMLLMIDSPMYVIPYSTHIVILLQIGGEQRRIPTALDVAYTVFNNVHVAPELAQMMQDQKGVKFRDGLDYHTRLVALNRAIENLPKDLWTSSIYFQWLATLRSLTTPPELIAASVQGLPAKSYLPKFMKRHFSDTSSTVPLPQAACTKAWQDRTLNTQNASWTQLRHDTILYVKQSFTCSTCCEYPAGYPYYCRSV